MELRTTEQNINDLLGAYEGIRRSSLLRPEQQALLPPTPNELLLTGKAKGTATPKSTSTARRTGAKGEDEDESTLASTFVRSLRTTEKALAELQPRVDKFRKRLFEIDPVTEKPRYGPKSQDRVRLLMNKHEFLCIQFRVSFPEEQKQQFLRSKKYQQQQLDLQEQRQEERRQEYSKQQELLKQKKEQELQASGQQQEQHEHEHEEEDEQQQQHQSEAVIVDANMNPDGSLIADQNISVRDKSDAKQCEEASPASLLFSELQKQYDLRQQEQQQQEASKEDARIKMEEESRRKIAEEEVRQKALESQRAAAQAAEEEAQRQRLHNQAEEARLRRREQEEAKKEAERKWLDSIEKGPVGVEYYLDILLQKKQRQQQQTQQQQQQTPPEGKDKSAIDPDRIVTLRSLCTLFEQIQKHPEEVNKRKIKLSNPNFHQDIGQHDGGIELLIAAGFRPTMLPAEIGATEITVSNGATNDNDNHNDIDNISDREEREEQPDIAFLISKEPNLEHDMDGWMAWFDLNKATLEILQTELQKIEGNNKRSRR